MLRKTIGQILPEAAEKFGDKTALIFNGRNFSFNELDTLTNRVANSLSAIGVGPGDRVTLYAQNCWEWVVAYYATAKLGAVINPINVMLTPEEVGFVVKDCGAAALFTTADRAAPILGLKQDTDLKEIIVFGDTALDGAMSFNEMAQAGRDAFDAVKVDAGELSTICYTSGTTGFPKGAMLSHRNVVLCSAITAAMNMRTEHDVELTSLPLPHVYGGVLLNLGFLFGITLVLLEKFDAAETLAAIKQHKVTIMDGVPTMYFYMLANPEFDSYDLSSLTRCVVGGQTMPAAKSEEWTTRAGCGIFELWGMTELAGPGLMQHTYGENRVGSVGVEMLYFRAKIVDPEDASREMPVGEVGELMVSGPFVMMGYYGNEEATREAIEPDVWMHSGDLARMDEDRYFYIVDRKKDMILTAGFNIYPAEIERVIAGHPAVAMVGVGRKADEAKGEIAKGYVVLKPGVEATPNDITDYCREHLAAYKVPREVQIVDDLPTTSTGKILRRELHTLD
ncbi:MAG: AMP-binding protein [Pseudomonadota bacterium]|nr:AMP-binding protein [Pseudomonadota bacterium]